ncbi:biotin-dependent carboxyltransferase family protein [uncultured Croceitalea sp.]|uniref:5-oxoprolinase subunit C family protein n=1 Tax=uncultured Croceitalea sp. TaxID=1798908 RepID=UPI00330654CB
MLKVLKPGFFTTIQDVGRFGYRDKGVPVSGAMDMRALSKANLLLENPVDAAVFEITMTGPTLLFEAPTFICLTGAVISATLNNEPIENYKVYAVDKGDILSYGRLESGFRAYLAVKDGFRSKKILGSSSLYYPLTTKKCLTEKDEIEYNAIAAFDPKISELKIDAYIDERQLTVSKGPEFDLLDDKQLKRLFSKEFTIAKENNRMAYQLKEYLSEHAASMLTSATLPGTVQLTPAGRLIILMKDGQTTGGYPRVLQLSENAITILAQKRAGNSIRFKLV